MTEPARRVLRRMYRDERPLVVAGILLGLGLGGFVDGILLHQALQWHHMLSSAGYPPDTVQNLQTNMLADGLFHVATWLFTLVGLLLLWWSVRRRNIPWSTSTFIGTLVLGWGLFNLVEGMIDHHLLGIHHVNETVPQSQWIYWDVGFLAVGVLLIWGGLALMGILP